MMKDANTRSMRQRWDDLQPTKTMLVWSCIGSVIVALIVGFSYGGWVTGGTARGMAATAGVDSRLALASAVCVENFLSAPDADSRLAELKAIDSGFRQRQFIEEGGWAAMPDTDGSARQAADLCAKILAALESEDEAASLAPRPAPGREA